MTSDSIAREIERLFETGAPRLTLDDLSGVEASRPGPSRSSRLALAAGATVVLGVGAVLAVVTGNWPGTVGQPGETCLTPPVEELAKESPVPMRLEPNPVAAGAEAILSVDGPVGVPARWQCWDGEQWVDTHYLMRGWSDQPTGAADVVELGPDVTVTWPAIELPVSEPFLIRIPDVPAGFYRIEDEVIDVGYSAPVFTIVQVVAPTTPPDPADTTTTTGFPTTTTVVATTTTWPQEAENVPFDVGPLVPRSGHSVVWTGTEMIVWGGAGSVSPSDWFADGAAFDPATDTWRMIAESPLTPRTDHLAEWTGSEMLIVGGLLRPEAAAYNPVTDTWREMPPLPFRVEREPYPDSISSVWTGSEMVVWHVPSDRVVALRPGDVEWRALPSVGLGVDVGILRWTGFEVYAFGIEDVYPEPVLLLGARLAHDVWLRLPNADLRTEEYNTAAIPQLTWWSGERFVAWTAGGREGRTVGYRPGDDAWSAVDQLSTAGCIAPGSPLDLGGRLIHFGDCGEYSLYDAETDRWRRVGIDGWGDARHSVWTGTEVLHWSSNCCYPPSAPFTVRAWMWTPPD